MGAPQLGSPASSDQPAGSRLLHALESRARAALDTQWRHVHVHVLPLPLPLPASAKVAHPAPLNSLLNSLNSQARRELCQAAAALPVAQLRSGRPGGKSRPSARGHHAWSRCAPSAPVLALALQPGRAAVKCWGRVAAIRCAIATLPTQADDLTHAAQVSKYSGAHHHALPALEHAVSQAGLLEASREPSQLSFSQSYSHSSQEASQDTCRVDPHEAAGGDACVVAAYRQL